MDPFSLVIGVGSLVEMSLQLGKCLKDAYEAAALFEEEVGSLLREIQDLESVNKSIEHLYRTETNNFISERLDLPLQDLEVWENTFKILQDCEKTVKNLSNLLEEVTGKNGVKALGWRDRIGKRLRKQAKDGELNHIKIKLSTHRESLNVSLTLLNLIYAQRGSKDAQKFGFQLHRQIASLQSRLPLTETDSLYDSLHSATTVASVLHLNKHFDTPKAVSSIYTGRQSYLDELKRAYDLSHSSSGDSISQKRFVIFGLGGSGKTQFCCKFASDNKQRFWGVFTVDASSPGNAQQSFIAIAKACGTNPNERAAKSWLSSSRDPWLLILDNADDTNLDIERYFPDGEQGLTLITTRNPSVKMHGTIGQRFYHFDRLDDDEASELLLKAADNREPRTPTIIKLALTVTRKLGALPLALIHAGNAIKAKYCELSNYNLYYDRSWQTIRQHQHMTGQEEDDAEYMKVYATYEIVYRGLEAIKLQRYKDAVQLLKLFSFMHYEHIPFDFLVATIKYPQIQREAGTRKVQDNKQKKNISRLAQVTSWSKDLVIHIAEKQFEIQNPIILPSFLRDADMLYISDEDCIDRLREALFLLTQLSLVTHYSSSDSYSMHPLVHTWIRERPQMKTRIQAVWCEAAQQSLLRCILLPPLNESVTLHNDLARRLVPHFTSVRKLKQKVQHEFARNRYKRNRPWPALDSGISLWGAAFLIKAAIAYNEGGEFVETENCLRTALRFYEEFLGLNDPRLERMILALSGNLWQQSRVNDAADLLEKVYQRNLKSLGRNHPSTLRIMREFGGLRRQQGRFAESLELLTKAKDELIALSSSTEEERFCAMEQLGITLRTCFHFEDARKFQEQGVKGMKFCLGERNAKTLISTGELAVTYKELGTACMDSNKDLARQYLDTAHKHASFAFEELTKVLGDKHPQTWIAQGTLWRIKAAMGEVDEAERTFSSLLPAVIRHLGDDHLGVLIHKNHHAKLLIQRKRYNEAETLLLEITKPAKYNMVAFIGDSPDRWNALWSLVECYQRQGKAEYSLLTCNELLEAMRVIRDGKEQTEISSTFWEMVVGKRAELMAIENVHTAGNVSVVQRSLLPFAAMHPVSHAMNNVVSLRLAGDLRQRGTW